MNDTVGDFAAVVRFQQAYAAAALELFDIPVGRSIIVTAAQDKALCAAAVKALRGAK